MKLDARLTLFMTLVSVFVMSLLLGNLIAGKLTYIPFAGEDRGLSVGEIPFPLTFILTDILNEFYGRKVVRRVTIIGVSMTALAFLMINLAVALPWHPEVAKGEWPGQFNAVFASATRIQIASMAAFVTAQFIDITVFFFIKRATGNRMLWLRATGSTAVSQLVDTIVVGTIGFYGVIPDDLLVEIIITAYLLKLAIAVLMTPVIYALHSLIERVWHLEPVPLEVKGGDVGGSDGTDHA